jgi:hypothetical protein
LLVDGLHLLRVRVSTDVPLSELRERRRPAGDHARRE